MTNECQNIEFDKFFFFLYHVLFIEIVFLVFTFNCQYVYKSLPFEF